MLDFLGGVRWQREVDRFYRCGRNLQGDDQRHSNPQVLMRAAQHANLLRCKTSGVRADDREHPPHSQSFCCKIPFKFVAGRRCPKRATYHFTTYRPAPGVAKVSNSRPSPSLKSTGPRSRWVPAASAQTWTWVALEVGARALRSREARKDRSRR